MKFVISTVSLVALLVFGVPLAPCRAQTSDDGPSFEELARQLEDGNPDVRSRALGRIGSLQLYPDKTIPRVIKALGDANFGVRADAANALGNLANGVQDLGEKYPESVAKLTALLDDQEEGDVYRLVRRQSAYALGKLGAPSAPAVPHLLKIAADPQEYGELRVRSTQAVAEIARASKEIKGEEAVGILIRLLDDPEDQVAGQAHSALASFGGRAKAAEPRLLELLKHQNPKRRMLAAYALAGVGVGSLEVERALLDRLDDADPKVQACALMSLEGINETYAFFFRNNVSSREVSEKQQALLKEIGSDAGRRERFVRLLRGRFQLATRSQSPQVSALRMLRELNDRECLPLLQKRFVEMEKKVVYLESADLRLQLLHAIAGFLPEDKVVPFLTSVESDAQEDPEVRFRAAIMLCATGDPKAIEHVLKRQAQMAAAEEGDVLSADALGEALKDPKLFVSADAFKSLQPVGAEGLAAMRRGVRLAQDLFKGRKREVLRSLTVENIHVEDGKVTAIEMGVSARPTLWKLRICNARGTWVPCLFECLAIE